MKGPFLIIDETGYYEVDSINSKDKLSSDLGECKILAFDEDGFRILFGNNWSSPMPMTNIEDKIEI